MDVQVCIHGVLGIVSFLAIAFVFSEKRRKVSVRKVLSGLILQVVLAAILIKAPQTQRAFLFVSRGVEALKKATAEGTSFVFGYVGGGASPFPVANTDHMFVFAFQALPMIIVISAISMLLFYWRVLPAVVNGVSFVAQRALGIGGALGTCAAAKIFFGQTDAPLLIRPYLSKFSRNELFSVMVAGMATTSMTLLVLYSTFLEKLIPGAAVAHILTSSVINVPAALVLAEVMIPSCGKETSGKMEMPYKFNNSMEAVSQGTADGLNLMWGIASNLIVVLALVFLANKCLAGVTGILFGCEVTLQSILGYVFLPIAWLMGVPYSEAHVAGQLLATKTVLNEIAAMIDMTKLGGGEISHSTSVIMTYALCGFANFGSIAIQIGGIGSLVPERKRELVELSAWALFAGTLASCMSGAVVSMLI